MRWWMWAVGALSCFALALVAPWTWLSAGAALAALFALLAAAFALLGARMSAPSGGLAQGQREDGKGQAPSAR